MYEKIKTQYDFSDYQMKQLEFLLKTLTSEFTKLILIGLFFMDVLPEYIFATLALALLRVSTGGLHCRRYISCLCVSFLYVFLCIRVLPLLYVPKLFQMILLFICLLTNYYIGPVTSEIHMALSVGCIQRVKLQAFVIIFFFLVTTYILPENPLLTVCFWVVILHTIQLLIAKIHKKGGIENAEISKAV